jgi:myo-inositol-1(or 4)-monophosphatase
VGKDNHQIYFLKVAVEAAQEAGRLLMDNFSSEKKIAYKGRIDLVTEMDTRSEELIVSYIKKEFPGHNILAEERERQDTDSEFTWIIDPLDGTVNYAHSFGFFCVSIALQHKDKGVVAGVVNAPYLRECYTAASGEGACLNGDPIRVSNTDSLERAMLATGFPYDIKESRANIDCFTRFLLESQAVRRPGSAAIDICSVAAGKFDGFWEVKLNPWDTAAGSLILREAGGIITDFKGEPFDPFKKEVLASNGKIHQQMMEVINGE